MSPETDMPEIPKIVAQRLGQQALGEAHPDPNVLAAFAEKSLTQTEHARVLTHLAACADCREVAALALPEDVTVPKAVPTPSPWFSWPVLRWGAALACVAVVGAAVGLRYRTHTVTPERVTETSSIAKPEAKSAEAPAPLADANTGTANLTAAPPQGEREGLRADLKTSPAPPVASRAKADLSAQSSMVSLDKATSGVPVAQPQTANLPSTNEVAVTGSATPAEVQEEPARDVPGKAKDALQEQQPAAGAMSQAFAARKQLAPMAKLRTPMTLAAGTQPRWTLSADGELQRSFNSGTTWQTIPFDDHPVFRALAANGLEVWVGGAKGVLYHSTHAGQQWKLVHLAANGQSLTSDIVRVEFTDALHGTVSTADQQTWITTDGGTSWQNQ